MLANEQVIDGRCERCGAEVTKRELTQWYFKITEYAQELLDDLDDLEPTWPDRVINAQRNWIGRSEGAHVTFAVEGTSRSTVYTTRPDTLFGATFMVVAADAALAADLVTDEQRPAYDAYLEEVRKASDIERLSTDRPKTGVFLGVHAINPVNGEQIPVWASDYVLADYGTGAIMAVPGQDQRDWDFAETFDLPIVRTVQPPEGWEGEAFTGDGPAINSPNDAISLDGMGVAEAKRAIIDWLEQQGRRPGRGELPAARLAAVAAALLGRADPDHPLPDGRRGAGPRRPAAGRAARAARRRPDAEGRLAAGRGRGLGQRRLPVCGGPAKRDSDTMDTFVDSSWYFLRYCSPHDDTQAFDTDLVNVWGPCDIYIGGVEHAVLHLLYARFFTMVLNDMGLLEFREPFSAQLNQGIVINEGAKMSKSKGNGVRLGEQLSAFGVDAVRLTLVFAGPPEDDIDWADMSPAGSLRFLQRAWRLSGDVTSAPGAPSTAVTSRCAGSPTAPCTRRRELVEGHRFNVMVARVMELVNATRKAIDSGCGPADPAVREAAEAVAILLSLVAPYTAEEMWERLGHQPTVARAGWPVVDQALLVEDSVTAVVQVQGKVRARLEVAPTSPTPTWRPLRWPTRPSSARSTAPRCAR